MIALVRVASGRNFSEEIIKKALAGPMAKPSTSGWTGLFI
jgi:hypothetical protein